MPMKKLLAPRLMVRLESRVIEFTNSSKSRELEETDPPVSDPHTNFPVARSQLRVSPAASQSASLPPDVPGSQKTEAEAILNDPDPNTSRSPDTNTSLA